MKKKSVIAIFLSLLCAFAICLTACSSYEGKTPQEVISSVYGDTEYTISFMAEGADSPVADITYSANSMPTLPTPTRVGYVFAGWYFDSSYTKPYTDGILYLYMCDVVLYAKWEQEEFSTNGVYDIEYSATIVDGSLSLGELAKEYGYKDWTQDIIADETYIEKSDEQLLLQIQYDSGILDLFNGEKVYTVTINYSLSNSNIYIADSIDAYSDTVKTLFIDITNMEFSSPIYFNVTSYNLGADNLSEDEIEQTEATYTVEFSIERLIGFSRPFEDTSVPLEDGYYLIRTYMSQTDLGDTMMDYFNPVYSYIIAEDGNYTLVKPMYPYFGITEDQLGGLLDPITANYFYRMTTFMPWQVCYEVDISDYEGQTGVESDYYPATYNAGYYKEFSIEFNAETGNCYNIIDLGSNLQTALVFSGSPTGFMETTVDLGEVHTVLTLDYEHITKITSIDYQPLEGDAFVSQEAIQYYPGDLDDLNERGKTFDATEEYGLTTRMINYFFTAIGLNSSYQSRTVYSSRITVSPTAATNTQTVADSRYDIAYFTISNEIFGYDPVSTAESGEGLYYDAMTLGTFTSSSMREYGEYRIGKSYRTGQTVVLSELFAEKVSSSVNFNTVSWQAYAMKDGSPDYSQPVTVDGTYVMDEGIAILFSWQEDGQSRISLVEAVPYEEPSITISDDNGFIWNLSEDGGNIYVTDADIDEGETYYFPTVSYVWGTKNEDFTGVFYESEFYYEDDAYAGLEGVNVLRVAYYTVTNDMFYLNQIARYSLDFSLDSDYMLLVYELTNIYGERYYIYFQYEVNVVSETEYTITDDEAGTGTIYDSGEIAEDNNTGEGLGAAGSDSLLLTRENYIEELTRGYYIHIGNNHYKLALESYTIYADGTFAEYVAADGMTEILAEAIWSQISDNDYAIVFLRYTHNEHVYTVQCLTRVTFSGSRTYTALDDEDFFTDYEYSFIKPNVYDMEGNILAEVSVSVYRYASLTSNELLASRFTRRYVTLTESGKQYTLEFSQTGKYMLEYSFRISLPSGNTIYFYFSDDLYVQDGQGEVTITYVTDEDHPFSDEIMRDAVEYTFADGSKGYAYTQAYSLLQAMQALGSSAFASNSDIFFGWSMEENGSVQASTVILAGYSITDFIARFGDSDPVIYAIWDPGITITAVANGQTQQRTIYMNSSGVYIVDFSNFQANAPAGYNFVGWTGGFLGSAIVSGSYTISAVDYDDPDLSEYLTITAEFRERLLVSYYIDSEYSNSYFLREEVNDGYYIENVRTPAAREGYTFVGWYIGVYDEDGNLIAYGENFDPRSDTVDAELCNTTGTVLGSTYKMLQLVAVFEDAEGNLVW